MSLPASATQLFRFAALGLVVMIAPAGVAQADSIKRYELSNKRTGQEFPPDYGLRIDGMLGGDVNNHWTFSFEGDSSVYMDITYDQSTLVGDVRIYGTVYGALDPGGSISEWTKDNAHEWTLDFTYSGVTIDDVATGYWTAPKATAGDLDPAGGSGTLTLNTFLPGAPGLGIDFTNEGDQIGLAKFDSPHASKDAKFVSTSKSGVDGFAEGWLGHTEGWIDDPDNSVYSRFGAPSIDFAFTATLVPEPTSFALFATAGLVGFAGTIRRRR